MDRPDLNRVYQNLLIIPGAAKSGTSSLHHYLNQHPKISGSDPKEPHYFSYNERFNNELFKQIPYNQLFSNIEKTAFYLDSSTSYLISNLAIKNIYSSNSNTKFIFLLRNPIDRIISHYNWLVGKREENEIFSNAIKKSLPGPFDFESSKTGNYKYYIEHSKYGKWISEYIKAFPIENMLFLTTSELREDPQNTLSKCFNFLNIEEKLIQKLEHKNQSRESTHVYPVSKTGKLILSAFPYITRKKITRLFFKKKKEKITSKHRKILRKMLEVDVKLLKNITNKSFHEWEDFE